MEKAEKEIDLGEAFDSIISHLANQFPSFKTIAAEDESRKQLPVPAIILQMSGLEPEPDLNPHTGQLAVRLRIEARIVMGHRTAKVRREIVKAAGAVAQFVQDNRFGVAWGAAEVVAIEPDEFAPVVDTHDVWLVEWGHVVRVGESYFINEGDTPTQVLTAWEPQTGANNADKYMKEERSDTKP